MILHVLETTFRHITNGNTCELIVNEVLKKETLDRAEELMQYFKGHIFVLLNVYNFVDAGLGIAFFNSIQFEQRREELIPPGRSFVK